MKIQDIYDQYNIMPYLQIHMYRVTAVANQILDANQGLSVSKDNVIKACLLHDIGKIVVFNLDLIPEALEPQGKDYWENIQKAIQTKYSINQHTATLLIVRELSINKDIQKIVDRIGFSAADLNLGDYNVDAMIGCYADQRVAPHGVLSLKERTTKGKKTFEGNQGDDANKENFTQNLNALERIESIIFKNSNIKPLDITDDTIAPYIEKLKKLEI